MVLKKFCFLAFILCLAELSHGQDHETPFYKLEVWKDLDVGDTISTFRSMYETRFNRLDIDEDGYLSKNEYLFLSRIPRNDLGTSVDNGEDKAKSSETDGLPSSGEEPTNAAEIEFRIFDADNDERISREEILASLDHIYVFDSNNDGKIEQSEFEEFFRTRFAGEQESNEEE